MPSLRCWACISRRHNPSPCEQPSFYHSPNPNNTASIAGASACCPSAERKHTNEAPSPCRPHRGDPAHSLHQKTPFRRLKAVAVSGRIRKGPRQGHWGAYCRRLLGLLCLRQRLTRHCCRCMNFNRGVSSPVGEEGGKLIRSFSASVTSTRAVQNSEFQKFKWMDEFEFELTPRHKMLNRI